MDFQTSRLGPLRFGPVARLHKNCTVAPETGSAILPTLRKSLQNKLDIGGPTRIRTWDQRIMSAFQAVTTYNPNQLTPKEV